MSDTASTGSEHEVVMGPSSVTVDEPSLELAALQSSITALGPLTEDQRNRVLGYLNSLFGRPRGEATGGLETPPMTTGPFDDARSTINPRRFFADKAPRTDIERVVVLGYLLANGGNERFDSSDLGDALVQAAVAKFDVIEAGKNAVKRGYFSSAGDRRRQLTVLGEQLVEALPDREAVSAVTASSRPKRGSKSPSRKRQS